MAVCFKMMNFRPKFSNVLNIHAPHNFTYVPLMKTPLTFKLNAVSVAYKGKLAPYFHLYYQYISVA